MGRKPMAITWIYDPRVFGSQNTWPGSRTRGTTRMFDGSGQIPADITIKYVAFHTHCLTKGDIPHVLVVTRLPPPPTTTRRGTYTNTAQRLVRIHGCIVYRLTIISTGAIRRTPWDTTEESVLNYTLVFPTNPATQPANCWHGRTHYVIILMPGNQCKNTRPPQ